MAEFEAKITGIADLSKAKQDFDSFKKSMEQPIKITVDASGFNAVWGNIQKQAQQSGIQIGNSLVQGVQKTIRSGSNKVSNNVAKAMFDGILPDKKILFNGGGLDAIGTYSDAVQPLPARLQKRVDDALADLLGHARGGLAELLERGAEFAGVLRQLVRADHQ